MFELVKYRSSKEVPAFIPSLVILEQVHSFRYNTITFRKVGPIDSYLKFKNSFVSLTFQNKVCRRILSTGLIIYCTVYYNLLRYRRIYFWQNLFSLYIYFEMDAILEDLPTEGYPSGRSTDRIISF